MKIYCVFQQVSIECVMQWELDKIFATKELAEKYLAELKKDWYYAHKTFSIEEHDVLNDLTCIRGEINES